MSGCASEQAENSKEANAVINNSTESAKQCLRKSKI
uniref:Uncharacterized protein n=1 Tax=Rhizophora mucronata TaxID=61149 RepID=A0A2P2JJH1_RHIMU